MTDFLDKLSGDLNKGIRNISSKGKELVEVTKRRSEIKSVQSDLPIKFANLGRRVYEMNNAGDISQDEVNKTCNDISKSFRRIADLESEISQIERDALKERTGVDQCPCPKCSTLNNSNDRFCFACGTPMVGSNDVILDESKTNCKSCGAALSPSGKFCIKCGAKVNP